MGGEYCVEAGMSLTDIKCFLLDMDGTFYLGENLLEGSLDFIDTLKRTSVSIVHLLVYPVRVCRLTNLVVGQTLVGTSSQACINHVTTTIQFDNLILIVCYVKTYIH